MAVGGTSGQFGSYTETYTTFSGADIVAVFAGAVVATLAGVTWSVTREKAPIYTMGSANPRSFSRGKRGIAGSLIFTMFDRPSLYSMMSNAVAHQDTTILYWARKPNLMPGWNAKADLHHGTVSVFDFASVDDNGQATNDALTVSQAFPYYNDQIPPFDITITFQNEYGLAAMRSIYGVEMLNEGSGASMDDIVLEETMTFVARDLGPMMPAKLGSKFEKMNDDPKYGMQDLSGSLGGKVLT